MSIGPFPDYDFSRDALQHPELSDIIFDGLGPDGVKFEPNAKGFSIPNAIWLINASWLAYCDEQKISGRLGSAGMRLAELFDEDGSQGYAALPPDGGYAIIAFRGSQHLDWTDFRTDASVLLKEFDEGTGAKVHWGFLEALDKIWGRVEKFIREFTTTPNLTSNPISNRVWLTGHSLGAALATIAAARMKPKIMLSALYTFGAPRVGDAAFAALLADTDCHRVVNCSDIVADVPPTMLGYEHTGVCQLLDHSGVLHTDPSLKVTLRIKTRGFRSYWTKMPGIRPGMVALRPFADHSLQNYAAGLGRALRKSPKKS